MGTPDGAPRGNTERWPNSAGRPLGICYLDTDLRFREINDWLAAMNGLKPAEHVGHEIGKILPILAESVGSQLRQAIHGREPIVDLPEPRG